MFNYPTYEIPITEDDIKECKKYLPSLKDDLKRIISRLDIIDSNIKEKHKEDISCICDALGKLSELVDNASRYEDTINRIHTNAKFGSVPRDISKYQGKSKEEIDKMFDDDLDNGVLIPTDYKRIMEQFNRDNEEGQNDNL